MACVENIPPANVDSEMEEGEIVDDVDDLSDISSEEEFLLRQRLQVLENYNNVLERKKAKRTFNGSGKQRDNCILHDLSEISGTDLDDNVMHTSVIVHRPEINYQKHKPHYKHKRREEVKPQNVLRAKDTYKKKSHRKKKIEVQVISESSEESDDEYRNKRRKLADAVVVHRPNHYDQSSLQDRIQKMLRGTKIQTISALTVDKEMQTYINPTVEYASCSPTHPTNNSATNIPNEMLNEELQDVETNQSSQNIGQDHQTPEYIIISTDDDDTQLKNDDIPLKNDDILPKNVHSEKPSQDVLDSVIKGKCDETTKKDKASDSDEDLELLRQHALKTKSAKIKSTESNLEPEKPMSEDEDSDTAELRLICLKSALLKKAIEMKRKQKLRKRLSQSSIQDDLLNEQVELMSRIETDNNTDIESVDMDIGSDGDEKSKDASNNNIQTKEQGMVQNGVIEKDPTKHVNAEDELDEDEDLLRAKLLTSLSKNLPNLVDPNVVDDVKDDSNADKVAEKSAPTAKSQVKIPENRIVINLGESDSEGEHEATKNLTKMHMKLSEQMDFQEKLDMFLKSTRMEVEKSNLPDVVQEQPELPKTPQKFVAKAVKHLPKSEQIEYKNLVKRMAELEKIKEARQSSMNLTNKVQIKDTLKPRNVTMDPMKLITIQNNLEEQIAMSRKTIAEESAKMLKLKEEATKLSQKYKIVATELKNISTAITLNKKEQRTVQSRLSRIRTQHQRLLNGSTSKHSKGNGELLSISRHINIATFTNKIQKENDPSKEELKTRILPSVKVSVVNDLSEETILPNPRLSVQVDSSNNKKTVIIPDEGIGDEQKDYLGDINYVEIVKENEASLPVVEKGGGSRRSSEETTNLRTEKRKEFDDYESPLQALGNATWEADPNAILCPFEVGGNCKDPDCKYLHHKAPTQ